MTKKILVSRHQLTECPACLAHIQIAEDWARTKCPFCSAPLSTAIRREKIDLFEALRSLQSTTGGLVAASLIGLGLVACEADTGLLDPTSLPTSDTGTTQEATDTGPILDAVVADAAEVPDSAVVPDSAFEDAAEPQPVPAYGIGPVIADAGVDKDVPVEDATEPPPVLLYGIAPFDAGGS